MTRWYRDLFSRRREQANPELETKAARPARGCVEFIGGPADGLRATIGSEAELDGVVGVGVDNSDDTMASKISLYGLSREAQGIRYRFLKDVSRQ